MGDFRDGRQHAILVKSNLRSSESPRGPSSARLVDSVRAQNIFLPGDGSAICLINERFTANQVTGTGSMTAHNRVRPLILHWCLEGSHFQLSPVAAENVIKFAAEKHGLQSSIRPAIFAARSRLTFRDLARLVRRFPKLELAYG